MVGDRGHAKLRGLQHVPAAGADVLVRVGWNSLRMISPDRTLLDSASLRSTLPPGRIIDVPVILTRPGKGTRRSSRRLFPARLVIMRQHEAGGSVRFVRPGGSAARSARLVMQPTPLAAAGFLMVLTSLPPEVATPEQVMAICRLRWQIELASRRLKSGPGIHRLAARDPVMARSWLLAHLILALMIEDAAGEVLDFPPVCHVAPHGPVSFWRIHGALRSALINAVLRAYMVEDIQPAASKVRRHLCNPPRQRRNQATAARAAT